MIEFAPKNIILDPQSLSSWQNQRLNDTSCDTSECYFELNKIFMRMGKLSSSERFNLFKDKMNQWKDTGDRLSIVSMINVFETISIVRSVSTMKNYKQTGTFVSLEPYQGICLDTFEMDFSDYIALDSEAKKRKEVINAFELSELFLNIVSLVGVIDGLNSFLHILSKSIDYGKSEIRSDGFIRVQQYIDMYYQLKKENNGFESMPVDWRLGMTDSVFDSVYEREGLVISV